MDISQDERLRLMKARALQLLSFSVIVFAILIIRLLYLQLIKHDFYVDRSHDQRLRIITLSPDRGDIFDRNGNILATSIKAYSIFAVPAGVQDKNRVSRILSKMLSEKETAISEKLSSNKPFVWIKRKIEEPLARKIMEKNLPGIGFLPEKKRVYPKKKLASQIIGFVGTDNQALSGIELSYDRYLKGEEGRLITEKDLRGREILTSSLRVLKSPTDGMDLTLTIDEPIQYKAENDIKNAVVSNHAKSGCAIVMDIKTGEILALAAYPDFDPNEYQKYSQEIWYNRVVTDVYEPGSTFKLITVASAMETGVIKKDSKIYCPDSIELGGRVIKNSHRIKFNTKILSVEEILRESVNTGVVQIALKLGKDKFYDHIRAFGFGQQTNVGLPGESRGILQEPSLWNKPDIGMISFGQSIAVTPIQLIDALASIANGGIRVKPRLVRKVESIDKNFLKIFAPERFGETVSPKTAKEVLALSETVVEQGTGRLAQLPDFKVGGKTGTAQKARPGGMGYMEGHYVSSFIGFAPLNDPQLAVLVILDDPRPFYWGERVASPVFKDIAEFSLRRLNIAPDKQTKTMI